jgi:hypothetical protein
VERHRCSARHATVAVSALGCVLGATLLCAPAAFSDDDDDREATAVRETAAATEEMPPGFLKVESPESSKWLDESIKTTWTSVPLRNVLAGEFGAGKLSVDNGKTLDTPIAFDAANHSRRVTLWRLSRQFGFTVRWAQQQEPRLFMGVPESEELKERMGGMLMTTMSPVQQVEYPKYLEQKQTGFVTREELIDGSLYFGVHTSRCLDVGEASAMVPMVDRYKTSLPSPEAILDARFTARVKWIKKINCAKATPKVQAKARRDIKTGSDEELISRWKIQVVTITDIEAGKTKFDKPTGKAWEKFKASVRPGDEVWYFCSPGETWQHLAGWRGYAVFRDGRVVDHITSAMN